MHHYREMANCTSIGRRAYLLLPRYAHRAEHYPLPNIPYATKFTQYTHHNTCVSEDESMKGILVRSLHASLCLIASPAQVTHIADKLNLCIGSIVIVIQIVLIVTLQTLKFITVNHY